MRGWMHGCLKGDSMYLRAVLCCAAALCGPTVAPRCHFAAAPAIAANRAREGANRREWIRIALRYRVHLPVCCHVAFLCPQLAADESLSASEFTETERARLGAASGPHWSHGAVRAHRDW